MLLEYALQTILILPSAAALLLATCLLSVQLFVVPLHFLPDAVVTRLRRKSSTSSSYPNDITLVKAYDFVVVGGTLASHVWFIQLQKQYPKASILLLEPPLLDYRSLIFTFFAGLDIGVTHNVPYFRAYPFYRASSTAELTQQANPKLPYVRLVVNTFEMLINELARDLAAATQQQLDTQDHQPQIKLPCYRIVQRVDPSTIHNGALGCRHVFPIQYSSLRNQQHLKVLLGVESLTWLGYTKDRRLAVQVNIQNQEHPFIFHVNRDLHLFDTINASGSTEPIIQEYHFDQVTEEQEREEHEISSDDDDDNDEEDHGVEKVGNSLHQRFYAFRRINVGEDSCALWTFDLAEEFDGDPSSDSTSAIEILVGFSSQAPSFIQNDMEQQEFFETATSFKVLPLTQVSEGWVGLEIQQTVYNDSKHHLMHWGYEMIQRVFDSLNSDGIMDIHSDTASVNTIPQSPGLSPTAATSSEQQEKEMTPTATTINKRSPEIIHARVHRPQVDYLVVKDDGGTFGGNGIYYNNKDNELQQQQQQQSQYRLPSYLARIWNLVFVDDQAIDKVSELLANPSTAEKHHPFSTTFARLLQNRASYFQNNKEDPAILRSTVVQSRELHPPSSSSDASSTESIHHHHQQHQDNIILDKEEMEQEDHEGRRSSYTSLNDIQNGNEKYYSSATATTAVDSSYHVIQDNGEEYEEEEDEESEEESDDDDEDDDDDDDSDEEESDDDDTATVTTSEEYEDEMNHSQSSGSASSSESSSDEDEEEDQLYEQSGGEEDNLSPENSEDEQQNQFEEQKEILEETSYDDDQLVDMSTDDDQEQQVFSEREQERSAVIDDGEEVLEKGTQEEDLSNQIVEENYHSQEELDQVDKEESMSVDAPQEMVLEQNDDDDDEDEDIFKETITMEDYIIKSDTESVAPETTLHSATPTTEAHSVNHHVTSFNVADEEEDEEAIDNELLRTVEDLSSPPVTFKKEEKENELPVMDHQQTNTSNREMIMDDEKEQLKEEPVINTSMTDHEHTSQTLVETPVEETMSKAQRKRKAKKAKKRA